MEIPELHHWYYSDLYFVNCGHVFFASSFSKLYLFSKHRMCSVVKWCLNNWISLLNFEWMAIISRQTRALFDSEHLSAAASIMIISNVSNEKFATVRYWLNNNLSLNINHTGKCLVFQKNYIYRYSKCSLMLNSIYICCLSWKFFYSKDSISILFYIYDNHKSSFIRVSVTNYAN